MSWDTPAAAFDGAVPVPPAFVDTHVHFFDVDNARGLRWSWAEQPPASGVTAKLGSVGLRRFTPAELWNEGHRLAALAKCVHIEAAVGDEACVVETEWLAELHQAYGAPHAAIAHVDLDRPGASAVMDAHLSAFDRVRGVRDLGKNRVMLEAGYVENVRMLGERRLIFEIMVAHHRFADLARLARACADTTIVLQHFGMAPPPAHDDFDLWRAALAELASCENVHLKLSGLAMVDPAWTVEDARRLIQGGLDAFGPARCVLGSNFPIDRPGSAYPDGVAAAAAALRDLSEEERRAVFAENAERLYRI
jgi:predicted TIM-barrel fold metal-dependent hydrolase